MPSLRYPIAALLLLTGAAPAQVLQPATITVTAGFSNPAGSVRSRLENASGPGIIQASALGVSLESPPRTADTGWQNSVSRLSNGLPLTVDAAGSPGWRVYATLNLEHYGQQFIFGPSGDIPTIPGGSFTHNFSTSASIVDITFSQPVTGGVAIISSPDGSLGIGQLSFPAGNRVEMVVPGATPLRIKLAVETGSGGTAGSQRRVEFTLDTWTGAGGVAADQIVPVDLTIPPPAALASLTGTFDISGESELATTLFATYFSPTFPGYGTWIRTQTLPGDPASGPFSLNNLTPAAAGQYGVQATTFLKRTLPSGNKATQFLSPRLILSGVPAVPGSLGTTLAMSPGYVRGQLRLSGPTAEAGRTPILSRIATAADADANGDGVPDGGGDPNAWLNESTVYSRTVADQSGYGGSAFQLMERSYTAPDAVCEYELALTNPSNAAAAWTAPSPRLFMNNPLTTEAEYFNTSYSLIRNGAPDVNVSPGSSTTSDATLNMGEVILTLRSSSPTVNIWQPQLQYPSGLTAAPANLIGVEAVRIYGWPTTSAEAGQRASLRTLLPAGTYTLRPTVRTVSSGNPGSATLAPFTITVPPRGRVVADNGVALNANVPICVGAGGASVNGAVNSDGAAVTSIKFSVDGAGANEALFVPGVDPLYSFTLPAGLAAGNHQVTVTVSTADGRTASTTQQFERDVTSPVITAPENILAESPIGGKVVNYPAPAASDNCHSVSVICNPPSGSLFPLGTTIVTCNAVDASGNTASDSFKITLVQPCPPPVRSHQFAGNADSHFTHPDKASYHGSVPMTIAAWVKRSDATRCETIISQNYQNSFWFGFCPKLRFYRAGGASADADLEVPENQWTHVAVSYDGAVARFYLNGQPAGTRALASSGTGSPGPVTIGADFTEGGSNYTFKGHLDEILIFGRALSPGELTLIGDAERRSGLALLSTFGSGGRTEDLSGSMGVSGPAAPLPQTEGILPKYLVIPQTSHPIGINGTIDATEYEGAEQMVLRYQAGPAVRDAIARLVYRDELDNKALYIGISGLRDTIAPWPRSQSFVSVYFQMDPTSSIGPPLSTDFRFSRRLDGTNAPGFTPVGFERGDNVGNFAPLLPGDPLNSAPAPFGIIGAGGDTMEFRFDLSTLGGDWKKALRLSLAHHWISGLGVDANAPTASAFNDPFSWSDVFFAGQPPKLDYFFTGGSFNLSWQDPGCGLILERSLNLTPAPWTPVPSTPVLNYRENIFHEATFDITSAQRQFFRLRQP